jgi:hypothetical protein
MSFQERLEVDTDDGKRGYRYAIAVQKLAAGAMRGPGATLFNSTITHRFAGCLAGHGVDLNLVTVQDCR